MSLFSFAECKKLRLSCFWRQPVETRCGEVQVKADRAHQSRFTALHAERGPGPSPRSVSCVVLSCTVTSGLSVAPLHLPSGVKTRQADYPTVSLEFLSQQQRCRCHLLLTWPGVFHLLVPQFLYLKDGEGSDSASPVGFLWRCVRCTRRPPGPALRSPG